MSDAGAKMRRPRGPKPRPQGELKRNSITFRALDDLRSRLMERAAKRGRSLSEEVEARLMETFERERLLEIMLGAGPLAGLFHGLREVLGRTLELAEAHGITERRAVAAEVRAAADFVLGVYFSDGEPRPSDPGSPLRDPAPGQIGIRAAWDYFMFRDEELFQDSRVSPKYGRTLDQIMARNKDGSFRHPYKPDDAE